MSKNHFFGFGVTRGPKVAQNRDRLKLFKGEIEIDAVMKDIVGDQNLALFPSNCFVKHRETSYNIESKLMFTSMTSTVIDQNL